MLLYLFCNKSHYENVPFEIPENWCWTTLGEISNYGQCENVDVDKIAANEWILELEDIEKDSGRIIQKLCKDDRKACGTRHKFYRNEILYSKLRTYLNKVLVAPASGFCTSEIIPIHCIETNPWFICFVLRSNYFLDYTASLGYGVKMPRLGTNDALISYIPLPPLSEQARIVDEVAKWNIIIDEIENGKIELESHIKKTKSKILDLAISGKLVPQDPNDEPAIELLKRINPGFKPCDNSHYENLPQGWVKLRLGDVCSFERGITFPSSAKCTIKQPGMIACIRTANVQDNLELDDLWYVGNEYIKGNTEKLVRKNDIIMSSANSRELVGKVSYVHDLSEQMTFGGFVLNIRANECILPFFLFLMLRTLYLKGYYLTIATQTTNIANLNTKILGNIEVLLPPLTEQERIINSVTNILASIENITAELS